MSEQRPPASQKPSNMGPTQNPTHTKAHTGQHAAAPQAVPRASPWSPHHCRPRRRAGSICTGLRGLPSPPVSQCDLLALAGNTSSPALLQIRLVASWEWIRACNSAAVTEACQDQRYSSSAFNPLTFNRKCTQLAGVAGTQEPGSWQDPSQATGPLLIPKASALQS